MAFLSFLIIVLFLFDSARDQKAIGEAQGEHRVTRESADTVLSKLIIDSKEKDGVAFIVKDTVDLELLSHFSSMSYEERKKAIGITGDFAIHFEDKEGRIIKIGEKLCIGSPEVTINGVSCG